MESEPALQTALLQAKAIDGLLKRVRGYAFQEKKTTYEYDLSGERRIKNEVITRKRVPPDLAAIMFVLRSLDAEHWGDVDSLDAASDAELDLSQFTDEQLRRCAAADSGLSDPTDHEEEPMASTQREIVSAGSATDDCTSCDNFPSERADAVTVRGGVSRLDALTLSGASSVSSRSDRVISDGRDEPSGNCAEACRPVVTAPPFVASSEPSVAMTVGRRRRTGRIFGLNRPV